MKGAKWGATVAQISGQGCESIPLLLRRQNPPEVLHPHAAVDTDAEIGEEVVEDVLTMTLGLHPRLHHVLGSFLAAGEIFRERVAKQTVARRHLG